MKSGMIASELVFKELKSSRENTEIESFCDDFKNSWAGIELKKAECSTIF